MDKNPHEAVYGNGGKSRANAEIGGDSEVIRLTQFHTTVIAEAGADEERPVRLKQYFGVDCDGNEHLYREFTSAQRREEQVWAESDPVWGGERGPSRDREHARQIIRDYLTKYLVLMLLDDGQDDKGLILAEELFARSRHLCSVRTG